MKKSYVFLEYIDDGVTNSIAIFDADESILKNERTTTKIAIGIIAAIIIAFIFIPGDDKSSGSDSLESKSLKEATTL